MSQDQCIVCVTPTMTEVKVRVADRTLKVCEEHQHTQDNQIVCLGCGKQYGDVFTFGVYAMGIPFLANPSNRIGVMLLFSEHCYFCRKDKVVEDLPENDTLFIKVNGSPISLEDGLSNEPN